jgi:hypothetical protein
MKNKSLKEQICSILRKHTISVLNNSVADIPKKGRVPTVLIEKIKLNRENILLEEEHTSNEIIELLKKI